MAGGRLLGGAVPRPRPEPPGLRGQVRGTWAPPALAVPCLRDPAGPGALRHLRRLGAQEPSRRLDRGRWHPVDLPRHDAHQIEGGHREDPHGGHAPPVGWRRGRADVRRAVPAHRQRLLRLLVRPLRVCPGGLEALPRRRPEGHARGRRAAGCGGWRVGGVRPPGPALPAGVGARPRGARGICLSCCASLGIPESACSSGGCGRPPPAGSRAGRGGAQEPHVARCHLLGHTRESGPSPEFVCPWAPSHSPCGGR
mmetsp:Transcript_82435/g.223376  ORF Transcript_82435/g.223376 Transcript_82435/m.223376 type:complete len:254 (-) Transcript_82435:84-845(-)